MGMRGVRWKCVDWGGSARNVGDAVENVGNQGSSAGNWGK